MQPPVGCNNGKHAFRRPLMPSSEMAPYIPLQAPRSKGDMHADASARHRAPSTRRRQVAMQVTASSKARVSVWRRMTRGLRLMRAKSLLDVIRASRDPPPPLRAHDRRSD